MSSLLSVFLLVLFAAVFATTTITAADDLRLSNIMEALSEAELQATSIPNETNVISNVTTLAPKHWNEGEGIFKKPALGGLIGGILGFLGFICIGFYLKNSRVGVPTRK